MPDAAGDLPRVLVIGSEPFNPYVGAGVTLSGFFGAWPKDRLADVYEGLADPDLEFCRHYYSLHLKPPFPANRALRQLLLAWRMFRGLADMTVYGGMPSPALRRFVEEFRPDVMFLELSSLATMDLTLSLSRRYGIPFIVHVPDDWMPRWPMNVISQPLYGPATWLINRRLLARLPMLMRRATVRLAISQSLADALAERYGVPFGVAYNCVPPTAWADTPVPERAFGEPIRVVYSGSIFPYGQSESLAEVADAVRALHDDGAPICLDIYTQAAADPALRARYASDPAVRVLPLLPREQFKQNLLDADVLLLPTNFDPTTIAFLRYSMPGKMAEYLMAGRPVLAYGPPEVEQVRYLQARGCGIVVAEHSPTSLCEALRRLATDAELRRDLGARARAAGEVDFDLSSMQEHVAALVTRVAGGVP